jgi:hypothetical protein
MNRASTPSNFTIQPVLWTRWWWWSQRRRRLARSVRPPWSRWVPWWASHEPLDRRAGEQAGELAVEAAGFGDEVGEVPGEQVGKAA